MASLILREWWSLRKIIIFLLAPILLLPVPIVIGNTESRCAYVLLLMAVYWTLEVIPVAITGLIPILLFPLLGVLPVKDIAPLYVTGGTVLFVCGLTVACAVERWNLHKRIALRMILIFGAAPNRLMLGLMLPTWFLSLWISNTATTAMMTPIVSAIIDQLNKAEAEPKMNTNELKSNDHGDSSSCRKDVEVTEVTIAIEEQPARDAAESRYTINSRPDSESYKRICKALTLAIAYAANVGGTGSLIGTAPNVVLLEIADKFYGKLHEVNPITFASWFTFGLPVSIICLVVIWLWMQLYFLRCKGFFTCHDDDYETQVKRVVRTELDKLGPFSFAEGATLLHFIAMTLLWFFRGPRFITGWGILFKKGYIKDACAAVLVSCVMFVFPSRAPRIFCCRRRNASDSVEKVPPLLNWDIVQHGVPWMIIWLIGGGFALAKGSQESGLSKWIGNELQSLSNIDPWVMILVLTLITATITEVTSNTAISALFLPILLDMAVTIRVHPLYIMFPVTLATSFAFMLPVATPPNAIVYSTGQLKLLDMIKAGFFLNLLCVAVLNIGANTWGLYAFDLGTFPPQMTNLTVSL